MKNLILLILLLTGAHAFAVTTPEIEAAVQGYLAKLSPAEVAKSNAYFEGGYWIQLWSFLLGLAVNLGLLASGAAARLRARCERLTRNRVVSDFLFIAAIILVSSALTMPFSYYVEFYREHQYDLSNMSLGAWLGDMLKGLAMGLVIAGLFFAVFFRLIRRLPRTWWMWGTAFSVVFIMFMAMIGPVYLAPVFNKYTPLENGPVREAILEMARSNDVPATEVYRFDASRQSKRVSANVSGMFGTTRISLNDNLLNRTTLPEIKTVMGHEMGHYVLNHAIKSVAFMAILAFIGMGLTAFLMRRTLEVYGARWGLRGPGDIAALPLLLSIVAVLGFIGTPVTNTLVRTQEIEADWYGLNLGREPDGEALVALKLSEYRKMSPGYWEEIFFYDHPSGETRIRMAMTWKFNQPRGQPSRP